MLLRVSGEKLEQELAGDGITAGSEAGDGGIASGGLLLRFAEAAVLRREAELESSRAEVCERLGADALVAAAGVVANFERMVRIADATGIPLDDWVEERSRDLRAGLGIDRFAH